MTCPHVEQAALARLQAAQWHAFYGMAVALMTPGQRAELVEAVARTRDHAAMLEQVREIRSLPEVPE